MHPQYSVGKEWGRKERMRQDDAASLGASWEKVRVGAGGSELDHTSQCTEEQDVLSQISREKEIMERK